DWHPIQEHGNHISGTFWDEDEFLAYVARRRLGCGKSILWSSPSYSKMWWQLAIVNSEESRPDDALWCIESGLELEQDQPRLWIEKGFVLNGLGRHQEALKSYETAAAIRDWAPAFVLARAFRGQGSALIDLGRLQDAKRAYVRSLE